MAFTTPEDFKRFPYVIANVDSEDENGDLTAVIDEQEKERLEMLLGSSLYNSFITALSELPDDWDPDTPYNTGEQAVRGNSVFESLVDANAGNPPVEGPFWHVVSENNMWLLLKNGDTYTYQGRQYTWVGMNKMLKPYIWFVWEGFISTRSTSTGRKEAKVENSTVVSASPKMCSAFNAFAGYAGACKEKKGTLYGYLVSKSEGGTFEGFFDNAFTNLALYMNGVFKDPGYVNVFNL